MKSSLELIRIWIIHIFPTSFLFVLFSRNFTLCAINHSAQNTCNYHFLWAVMRSQSAVPITFYACVMNFMSNSYNRWFFFFLFKLIDHCNYKHILFTTISIWYYLLIIEMGEGDNFPEFDINSWYIGNWWTCT